MSRRERLFLIIVAVVMVGAAATFRLAPPEIGETRPAGDPTVLAARVANHPSDWEAASALTEVALDARVNERVALWRAAYAHAARLAPERTDPPNAFARAAFFHWQELSDKDRRDALNAFAPLLRRPGTFGRMVRSIFELTGNLNLLRAFHPPTEEATRTLIALALPNGLFADYRALRAELAQQRLAAFSIRKNSATPEELIAEFPPPPYRADSEPLIVALLQELHRRQVSDTTMNQTTVDGIVDYALRHDLAPLDGLEGIARSNSATSPDVRLRLAQKLGLVQLVRQLKATSDPRRVPPVETVWQGLCGPDVCSRAWRMVDAQHGVGLDLVTVSSDNVPPYVEIYADDALRAEGEVAPTQQFVAPVGNAGAHRIEILLVNPVTRNSGARRVRIDSLRTL